MAPIESQTNAKTDPWWVSLAERETACFLRRRARRHPALAGKLRQDREDWVQEAHRALLAAFPETHGPLQGQDVGPILVVIRDGLREAWHASGLGREQGKTQDWPAPASPDQEAFPRPWEMEPGREPDPADEAALREQIRMLQASMNELRREWPEGHRLIHERYYEDLSVSEIAFRRGVSEGAVWSDLRAARSWLSQRLQPEHETPAISPVQGEAA